MPPLPLFVLFAVIIQAIAAPLSCEYCTSTCDRQHDNRTDLFRVFVWPKLLTTEATNYLQSIASQYADRVEADGGNLFGPHNCNLLQYVWAKVKSCDGNGRLWGLMESPFFGQVRGVYAFLRQYQVFHVDRHCTAYIQDHLPQRETEFQTEQCDPTMSIRNETARQIIAQRHLFSWNHISLEKAKSIECTKMNDFLDRSRVTSSERGFGTNPNIFFRVVDLRFLNEHLLKMAEWRFTLEEVRQDLDKDVHDALIAICSLPQTTRRFFQRLVSSLHYIRHQDNDTDKVVRKEITAEGLQEYLQPTGLLTEPQCNLKDLKKWLLLYRLQNKALTDRPRVWFRHPALFDRALLRHPFYGKRNGRLERYLQVDRSENAPSGGNRRFGRFDFAQTIRAIEEDYNEDRSRLSSEEQVYKDYYIKILFTAVKEALLRNTQSKLQRKTVRWVKKHPYLVAGGSVFTLFSSLGVWQLYAWYRQHLKTSPLPSISEATFSNSSLPATPTDLAIITTTATAPSLPYPALVITLIAFASLSVFVLLLLAAYHLYKMSQRFSEISFDDAVDTTAIRVVGTKPKTTTKRSSSSGATLK